MPRCDRPTRTQQELSVDHPLTLRDTNPALNESSKKVTHRQLSQTAHKGGRSRRTTSPQLHNNYTTTIYTMATFAKSTFNASVYSASRPTYPSQLLEYIFDFHRRGASQGTASFQRAVDAGCGTGTRIDDKL